MRLRSTKTELEEMGEESEYAAETMSELQGKILGLTHNKVNIFEDDNTYKSTIQILREVSAVYDELTDKEQAALLELMASKRNANALAAILQNANLLDEVTRTSMDSAGSAVKENEKYLDSINGKIEQFSARFQELSSNVMNSDLVKFTIDTGSGILGFLNAIIEKAGSIPSLAAAALGALSGFKNIG